MRTDELESKLKPAKVARAEQQKQKLSRFRIDGALTKINRDNNMKDGVDYASHFACIELGPATHITYTHVATVAAAAATAVAVAVAVSAPLIIAAIQWSAA